MVGLLIDTILETPQLLQGSLQFCSIRSSFVERVPHLERAFAIVPCDGELEHIEHRNIDVRGMVLQGCSIRMQLLQVLRLRDGFRDGVDSHTDIFSYLADPSSSLARLGSESSIGTGRKDAYLKHHLDATTNERALPGVGG